MKRAITIALAALLASPLHAAETAPAEPAGKAVTEIENAPEFLVPRNDIKGLPNFAKVSDELYRGAQPTAEGFKALKQMGVKTVVNLRVTASDREAMAGLGLQYVEISFKPWHPEDEDILPFLRLLGEKQHLPVFVHCKHGADRTGTMVALYRMAYQSWTRTQAVTELPRFGFHSIWNNLKGYLLGIDVEALKQRAAPAALPTIETVK